MTDWPTTAVQNVTATAGFAYGAQGADIHVHGDGTPLYLLEEYPRPAPEPDLAWLRSLPSRMLDARHEVVPFTGRETELADLRSWRDGGARLAVRLLHAPGGQGKTRLGGRFAAECRTAGWTVAAAWHGAGRPQPSPGSQNLRLDESRGVLLVVDYADRWDHTALVWLLRNGLLHRADRPARVLLLARTNAGWRSLRSALDSAGIRADVSDGSLGPVASAGGDGSDVDGVRRAGMYGAARDSFARAYGLPDPGAVPTPANLDHPDFGLVLTLHVAALVAVDAYVTGAQPPTAPDALTRYLLDREQQHWEHLYRQRVRGLEYATPVSVMARTAFTAALTGPLSYPDAVALLERVEKELPADRILTDHGYCYPPPAGDDPVTVLAPLYPDRLAEDFLALSLSGHHDTGLRPQPWAPTRLRAILRLPASPAERGYLGRAVTVLAAAAARWPHVGPGHLHPLLLEEPRLALAGGNAALTLLAAGPTVDAAVLEAVERVLPPRPHIDFDTGAAAVTNRLVEELRGRPVAEERRAELSALLGCRLSFAGRHAEAVETLDSCVAAYRALAGADPDAHTGHLTGALDALAVALSAQGRRDEAAAAIGEAVELLRGTVGADPEAEAFKLALVLHNLSHVLAEQDRGEEALDASREAVELLRPIAGTHPERAEPMLAMALDQLGLRLRELDRHAEALTVAQESNGLHLRSVRADPRGYLPQYAKSIANLGVLFAAQDDRPNARQALHAAIDMLRPLAEDNPDVYRVDLAKALMNLAAMSTGEPSALDAARESVALYRELAAVNPDAHLGGLALALVRLGGVASMMDEGDTAIDAYTEALSLCRAAPDAVPPIHRPAIAVLPFRLGRQLHAAGRDEEAFAAAVSSAVAAPGERVLARLPSDFDRLQLLMQGLLPLLQQGQERVEDAHALLLRVIDVQRSLLDTRPEWSTELANTLALRVQLLIETGAHASVEEVSRELIDVRRTLVPADPGEHEPALLHDLEVLVTSLVNQDRYADALPPTRAACELARRLSDAGAVPLPRLAAALSRFVFVRLRSGEELDDARTAAPEAVALYQRLVDEDRDTHLLTLRAAVDNLAHLVPEPADDAALAGEAALVDGYRTLARVDPDQYRETFVAALHNHCIRLRSRGRTGQALRAMDELIGVQTDPADLATVHNDRAVVLRDLGRHGEARVSLEAAVDLSRRFTSARRKANRANIAVWLLNLGCLHADLGSPQQALAPLHEAVAIYRRLAAASPEEYRDRLGSALNDLGTVLHELGKNAEAVATTGEAVAIRRRLAAADPDAPDPDLARSLHNLAGQLSEAGRPEDALAAAREAVELRTRLAIRDPQAYVPRLASSLCAFAQVCAQNRRDLDVGLAAARQSMKILRALAATDPGAFGGQMRHAQRIFAEVLDARGQARDAAAARRELHRKLGGGQGLNANR